MNQTETCECLYSILECEPTATLEQIKKSYQSLVLRHHPDKNSTSGSEETFHKIDSAWKVLRDPELRKQYDAEAGQRDYNDVPIVNESLRITDLQFNETEQIYEKSCRCGGSYSIDKEQLGDMDSSFYLSCSECSLVIEVLINK